MTTTTDRPRVEGKTKQLYPGDLSGSPQSDASQPDTLRSETLPDSVSDILRVVFKDTATAFNGQKKAEIPGKGALNAAISAILFEVLVAKGLPTCFIRRGERPYELIYRRLTMIPLEVVVRNVAYGSLVSRFGMTEGAALHKPLVEFFYKSESDPPISEALILELNLVPTAQVLSAIKRFALGANEALLPFFAACGVRCADFKLEFGFDRDGQLLLGDELSPDNFRLRDLQTGAVLDKDVFRLDLGDVTAAYQTLLNRLQNAPRSPETATLNTYTADIFTQSRKNILNPESKAILEAVHAMGHTHVTALTAGKRFVVQLQAESLQDAERQARHLADTVLSNPVIEEASLSLHPSSGDTAGDLLA